MLVHHLQGSGHGGWAFAEHSSRNIAPRFDPDRWTPENEATIPRYAYLPFGAGPHVCIGNHFAMLEAQLVLATFAQRVVFDLVPAQRIEPEPLITLRPRGGIRVVVRRWEGVLGSDTRC